jgi:hypothetical protein
MGLLAFSEKWLKLDFMEIAEQTLLEMDDFIADLNRKQLAEGKRSDGSDITPEYSGLTELLKRPKSGLSGVTSHVTLFDTGSFHKSIVADIYSGSLILDATDGKTSELMEKYNEKILGLTKESIIVLRNEFYPKYITKINKALA